MMMKRRPPIQVVIALPPARGALPVADGSCGNRILTMAQIAFCKHLARRFVEIGFQKEALKRKATTVSTVGPSGEHPIEDKGAEITKAA